MCADSARFSRRVIITFRFHLTAFTVDYYPSPPPPNNSGLTLKQNAATIPIRETLQTIAKIKKKLTLEYSVSAPHFFI